MPMKICAARVGFLAGGVAGAVTGPFSHGEGRPGGEALP